MVSSGDSGIYGMTGVLLEVIAAQGANLQVVAVPGVTAASAAAALLGAPLMHDFAVISLSDLMTTAFSDRKANFLCSRGGFCHLSL